MQWLPYILHAVINHFADSLADLQNFALVYDYLEKRIRDCFWLKDIWASARQNLQNGMCTTQRRFRSAWASAQSDQSLRCPQEESLCPYLPTEGTAKTLISLGGCQGWSVFAGRTWNFVGFVMRWLICLLSCIHPIPFPPPPVSAFTCKHLRRNVRKRTFSRAPKKTNQPCQSGQSLHRPHEKKKKKKKKKNVASFAIQIAPIEDSDQSAWIAHSRLIWIFTGRTFCGSIITTFVVIRFLNSAHHRKMPYASVKLPISSSNNSAEPSFICKYM